MEKEIINFTDNDFKILIAVRFFCNLAGLHVWTGWMLGVERTDYSIVSVLAFYSLGSLMGAIGWQFYMKKTVLRSSGHMLIITTITCRFVLLMVVSLFVTAFTTTICS